MEPAVIPIVAIAQQITSIVVPIVIVVGVISNAINILVLTRPALYRHACSHYFLAVTVGDLLYCGVFLVYRFLLEQFQMDLARANNGVCKFILYIGHLGVTLAPSYVVLASIDRWCVSSSSARLRGFSSVKTARWMISSTTVLLALILSNSLVTLDVRDTDPFGCTIRGDSLYKQVYAFIQVCIVAIIIPCLMVVFGLLTVYNVNKVRVEPAAISRERRTANQLVRMVLVQVGTHLILNLPTCVTYIMFILPNDMKYTTSLNVATIFSALSLHTSYTTAFFLYVISAQVYRKELIQLAQRIYRPNAQNQVHSFTHTKNSIAMTNRHTVRK